MFLAAADALTGEVTDEDRMKGLVYPPLWKLRSVSAQIAKAVASKAYELGLATNLPKPPNLLERIEARMWDPQYRRYR
jgi:malate dehydrogenase (oxaloacetate-decarboxylating)(NADP+)